MDAPEWCQYVDLCVLASLDCHSTTIGITRTLRNHLTCDMEQQQMTTAEEGGVVCSVGGRGKGVGQKMEQTSVQNTLG